MGDRESAPLFFPVFSYWHFSWKWKYKHLSVPNSAIKFSKCHLGLIYFAFTVALFYFSLSRVLSDDFSGALVTDRSCTQPRKQLFEEHDDGCLDELNGVSFYPSSKSIRESDSQLIYSTPRRSKRLVCTYIHVLCRHSFFFFVLFCFWGKGWWVKVLRWCFRLLIKCQQSK